MFNKISVRTFFKKFDYILLGLVLALTAIGIVAMPSVVDTMNSGPSILKTQLFSIALGLFLCLGFSILDYSFLRYWGIAFYIIGLLMLMYVIPFGYGRDNVNIGSNSWIDLFGVFSFQPSELMKVAYMMFLPSQFELLKEEFSLKRLIFIAISGILPIGLILMQPDLGTATVFAFSFAVLIFVYGIKYRYIILSVLALGISLPFIWMFLDDWQKNRIRVFIDPTFDPTGAGYQTSKSIVALGSGGWSGAGLFNGIQTQGNGIPIKESDFIFSAIGEELGFIGCAAIVLLAFGIIIRCIYIASKCASYYGQFIVAGMSAMIAFHFIENIGMNIGLLPVTGIPLPFISAGGTNLIGSFAMIGIIISASIRREQVKRL
ncbi:MAG: FtsW/RodA/SpoVE family cell cycle protein [Clostridia bacterium]|jgi:rod shape determining protein RodA|nr:FtsW/RodA/SpoVE family cell cycle protein [Clostridia bacterium]MDD4542649.1 FtsW/RodA/SpoVE family cell cycle protein [Clostridia bacterium]